MKKIFKLIPIMILWAAVIVAPANAQAAYPPNLWKGLMGEALGDGRAGMTAVCHVYKNRINRGMPLGCCALKRKNLDGFIARQAAYGKKIGRDYIKETKSIVKKVFNGKIKDPTGGADHYENEKAFGRPYWAKHMVVTARIKSHVFYKEK